MAARARAPATMATMGLLDPAAPVYCAGAEVAGDGVRTGVETATGVEGGGGGGGTWLEGGGGGGAT
jgi:hypothetical protein